ncbi:MAG TPA: assembly protein [Methylococcales bacterium]|nr:assembly protein [Methylococcales bacterium]
MAVYCVTGKLGAGKTLAAVARIRDYLNKGRKVATNLDIKLENLINPFAKKTVAYRLPDIPNASDMEAIGLGYDGDFLGDDHNGLIVLDECAKWLNSRDYRDQSRKGLIDWMIHARKKRWDIIFIIQDIEAMDKQFRDLFCEFGVYCRRMDRYKIPVVSIFTKLITGKVVNPPRLHVGLVKYGFGERAPVVDRWWYRGNDLYDAYDTEQGFSVYTSPGLHSLLPPNTISGQYISKNEVFKNGLRNTSPFAFLLGGLLAGSLIANALESDPYSPNNSAFSCNSSYEDMIGCDIAPHQLKEIIAKHRSGKESEGTVSDPSDTFTEDSPQDDLPRIYITGSVAYDSGQYDYFFEIDGEPVKPWSLGFRVYDITDCSAMLVNVDNPDIRRKVSCKHGEKSI